jgi:phenylalanyl-tRNA synthetase alpha chain
MTDITALQSETLAAIHAADSLDALEAIRIHRLGKQGSVTALLKSLGGMSPEERAARNGH